MKPSQLEGGMNRNAESEPALTRRRFVKCAVGAFAATIGYQLRNAVVAADMRPRDGETLPIIQWIHDGGMSQAESLDPHPDAIAEMRGTLGIARCRDMPGEMYSAPFGELAEVAKFLTTARTLRATSIDHPTPTNHLVRQSFPGNFAKPEHYLAALGHRRRSSIPMGYLEVSFPGSGDGLEGIPNGVRDICDGCHQDSRRLELRKGKDGYTIPSGAPVGREVLRDRNALLHAFDATPVVSTLANEMDRTRDIAMQLLRDGGLRMDRKNPDLERFFRDDPFGVAAYCSMMLVEAGAATVTVRTGHWDYHDDVCELMGKRAPALSGAMAAQIKAVEAGAARPMVICGFSEFGRTPIISESLGREHWPNAHAGIFYGGRFARGYVAGATDTRWNPTTACVDNEDVKYAVMHAAGEDIKADDLRRARLLLG